MKLEEKSQKAKIKNQKAKVIRTLPLLPFAFCLLPFAFFPAAAADLAPVVARRLDRSLSLPGEFRPYQEVAIYARVPGFVEEMRVDVGSQVKKGDLLAALSAPELLAQRVEAEAKAAAVLSQRAEAEAKVAAAQSAYDHLKAASATPGVISGNELIQAEKGVDAAKAHVLAIDAAARAARASVEAIRELEAYLKVLAPFDGVITERTAHPGALVGPAAKPLLRLEQNTRLRLIVSVPEVAVSGIVSGAKVPFTLPAFPGEHFTGTISRNPRSMDAKTRSLAVELDVANPGGRLSPGMYPTVSWPVRKPSASLLVPPAAVVTTTERTFVIRAKADGTAEWVNVSKGAPAGDLMEVFSPALKEGDQVLRRASDETRDGTRIK